MKRIIMKTSLFLVIALVAGMLLVPAQNIQAKGKTVYYNAAHYTVSKKAPRIKKIDIKKNRLIIWGSLEKEYNGKTTKLKYKKRTFKLSKKVKVIEFENERKIPKKNWKRYLNNDTLYYYITVKNGKVIEIGLGD